MNHKELHEIMSEDLKLLREGKIKPQVARERFNGAGKIIANCKNQLAAIHMGFSLDVPLLEIKKIEVERKANLALPLEKQVKKPYEFSPKPQ